MRRPCSSPQTACRPVTQPVYSERTPPRIHPISEIVLGLHPLDHVSLDFSRLVSVRTVRANDPALGMSTQFPCLAWQEWIPSQAGGDSLPFPPIHRNPPIYHTPPKQLNGNISTTKQRRKMPFSLTSPADVSGLKRATTLLPCIFAVSVLLPSQNRVRLSERNENVHRVWSTSTLN